MSSPWTELLFLHGHLADWRLARRLAGTAPPADGADAATGRPHPVAWLRLSWSRLCLGIGDGEVRRQ